LVKYEYIRGKRKKRYTRRGVNDTIKWIRKIWKWGMGRQFIIAEQVQDLEEVKSLQMGDRILPRWQDISYLRVKYRQFPADL